jgi:hypothetical protein
MRKFSLVVFPDEVAAFRGFHALHLFHRARSVSLHGAAVFERGENGAPSVRKRSPVVPLGGGSARSSAAGATCSSSSFGSSPPERLR